MASLRLLLSACAWGSVFTQTVEGPVDCSVEQVHLDFASACAGGRVRKNLGGLGPDTGPEEVRYLQIATHNGVEVDLVIKLAAGQPWVPKRQGTLPAGDSSGCVPDNYRGRLQFVSGQRNAFIFEIRRYTTEGTCSLLPAPCSLQPDARSYCC